MTGKKCCTFQWHQIIRTIFKTKLATRPIISSESQCQRWEGGDKTDFLLPSLCPAVLDLVCSACASWNSAWNSVVKILIVWSIQGRGDGEVVATQGTVILSAINYNYLVIVLVFLKWFYPLCSSR